MKCKRCGGNKKVQGLGFIEITCPICKGSGEFSGDGCDYSMAKCLSSSDSLAKEVTGSVLRVDEPTCSVEEKPFKKRGRKRND